MKYLVCTVLILILSSSAYAQEEEPPVNKPEGQEAQEPSEEKSTTPPLQLGPEEMSRQVALLGSRFFADRARAQSTIARVGKAAAPHLKEALKSDNALLRMRAVESLARIKQPEAVRPIMKMLRHSSPALRKSARRALVMYGPEIIPVLNKLVASGELESSTLPDAVLAQAYREPLLKLFAQRRTNPEKFQRRCEEIAKLGAVPALFALLNDSLRGARDAKVTTSEIINVLGYFNDKRVIERLNALYESPAMLSYRRDIAIALARLGSEKRLNQWVSEQVKQSGNPESTYNSLGYMFHKLKDWENAEKFWRKAFETAKAAGRSTNVHLYNLACALSLGNKHDKAVQTLKSAIAAGYRNFSWMSRDEDFDPIRKHAGYLELVKEHCPELMPKKPAPEEKKDEQKQDK